MRANRSMASGVGRWHRTSPKSNITARIGGADFAGACISMAIQSLQIDGGAAEPLRHIGFGARARDADGASDRDTSQVTWRSAGMGFPVKMPLENPAPGLRPSVADNPEARKRPSY